MDTPHIRGKVTLQAHVDVPSGVVEEEYARNGFFGRYAHLYRQHPPVDWTRIDGELRPRAYDANKVAPDGDYLTGRVPLLANADCQLAFAVVGAPMSYYYRNADGDETLFIHAGAGTLECDFGQLAYEAGDYLVVPRGTTYRFAPSEQTKVLVIETAGEVAVPDRGMLGQHALFDPAVMRVPTLEGPSTLAAGANPRCQANEWEVRIKRAGKLTSVFYPYSPLDVVGWKGTLTVWQLNVRDIRPVMSDRYHLPPTAHTTFVAHNVAICTFAPRPLETGDAGAMKVPFYHSNIDFDEVIFYHHGRFFSRDGITPGMVTFHPQGIHHGPQAKAVVAAQDATHTNEIAVMIDTKRPLEPCEIASTIEQADYWRSWQRSALALQGK